MTDGKICVLMQKLGEGVKLKVLLGYFFLLMIASVTVWLIYSEIRRPSEIRTYLKPLNDRVIYINDILSNLYEAEGLERAYYRTAESRYYESYNNLMNAINRQIDTLVKISGSTLQETNIDSIRFLIEKKRKNLQELVKIKRAGSSDDIYRQALSRLTYSEDSINYYIRVYKTVSDSLDSIYIKTDRKRFLDRLVNVFSPSIMQDSVLQVNVTQSVQVDSVLNRIPADSVRVLLTSIIDEIRDQSIQVEQQLSRMELEIMENSQTITLQLRNILTVFEEEAFRLSYGELEAFHGRMQQMTKKIIILGSAAFITIVFFMILIMKDISKAKHYRVRLEAAKAYSETLLKSKEQFMLNITHDLKSPLGTIMGYARLMSTSSAEGQKKYYLENINKASDHILRLIHDLVDLARLDTGKFKLEMVPFNLKTLAEETVSGFYPAAMGKNISLQMIYKAGTENLYKGDPVRMKQVLGNLLSNAIKFTDDGEVILSVSILESFANTDRVKFQIRDTGIGISEEYQKIIFDEFARVIYKDRSYEGTGLGLTISQKIVSLLDGSISVKSRPGEGSLFTIQIPLEKASPDLRIIAAPEQHMLSGERKHVLLIDDDEVLLNMTAEILEKANMSVTRCNHPSKVLQLLDGKFDIILTDINMPSMTGFDILSLIRQKSNGDIPVFAVTGKDTLKTGDYSGLGFNGCLYKPFTPEQLLNVVNTALYKPVPNNAEPVAPRYNLEQIMKFAAGDTASAGQILSSFIETTLDHVALFKQYLRDQDYDHLSDLAHKMLAMFRQIEAAQVAAPLSKIEHTKSGQLTRGEWLQLGNDTLEKIERLIEHISQEQGILQ